jgi:hypothetical protein
MTKDEFLANGRLPRLLTLEEVNDPYKVLTEFFTSYSLEETRFDLKDWFHAALEDDIMSVSGKSSNLFSFYQNIEKLIEANYLINNKPGNP